MRWVLLWGALALQSAACAQTVGLHLATAHQRGGYQSATAGLYGRTASGATAGLLRNSEGRFSFYGAWTWQHGPLAVTAGAISGYRSAAVSPLLVPSLRLDASPGLAWRLALIPKPRRDGSAALHLSAEFPMQ